MTSPRDAFLQRVKDAVARGNRAGQAPALPPRGQVGYQGAGGDPLQRFTDQLAAAGGVAHVVSGEQEAVARIIELVRAREAERILLGRGPVLDSLRLRERLEGEGLDVLPADELAPAERDIFYSADLGISGVAYLIAETGSVVVTSRPDDPRSVSLLPPIHIAVAAESQLLPDLFDLFEAMQLSDEDAELPSCTVVITGPSKTGDIELKLVTGVHGPGEVHVVLVR